MAQLNKDQKQKIFLSGLFMAMLIYGYFTFLIGPSNRADKLAAGRLADLDGRISTAASKIKRLRNIEDQAHASSDTIAQINALLPEGEPIAWFPPHIRAFFDRQGIKESVTRLDSKGKFVEPELADYNAFTWGIELPAADYVPFGIALAGLENEEPLLEITRLQISNQPTTPQLQRVSLTAVAIMR